MTTRRSTRVAALVALLMITSCANDDGAAKPPRAATSTSTSGAPASAELIAEVLQQVVDRTVATAASIPGLVVHIEAPARGVDVTVAAGVSDRATNSPLTPDATFRIASNTKTFTAAAMLRLMEDGLLELDDLITSHLSAELVDTLAAGGYRPEAITIRQLLLHTSGLYDFGRDPEYIAAVDGEPTKQWTRLEQVQFAMDHGQPHGAPGQVYAYADTGYILLGDILERTTSTGLAEAYRTLLDFRALGLDDTYLESAEAPPSGAGPRAHQYFGTADGFDLDPSADFYGAAGLVATVEDLSRFYRALLRGEVFREPGTLETMLEIPSSNTEAAAAMGLFKQEIAGETCWGFSGFWGSFAVTCPEIDVTMAASIDQAMPGEDFDADALLAQLSEAAGVG